MLISLYQEGDENILDKHAKGLSYIPFLVKSTLTFFLSKCNPKYGSFIWQSELFFQISPLVWQ